MADQNIYDMADLWTGGTNYTSIKMDATNTSSDASTLLMDLQVDSSSQFSVGKQGNVVFAGTLTGVTSLTVDDIVLNGKVMTMTGSSGDTAVFTVGTNGTLAITTVDTAGSDGNITITADGDINLVPASGDHVLIDGAVNIDAGVITGVTSLTSTVFVGALTGEADTVTTNANLTGEVVSSGNAATLGAFTVSALSSALSDASISGNNTGDESTASVSVSGVGELATSAEYRSNSSNVRLLESNQVWDAMAEVQLTSSGNSVAWDMSLGIDFEIDLTENTTIANPSNTTVGKKGRFRIEQDAGGTNTVAWGTSYEFAGGLAPTASTGGDAEDIFYYDVITSTRILVSAILNIS